MHVLFVTEVYPPDNGWGGIGTYVYNMAKGLIDIGHNVSILCAGNGKYYTRNDRNLTIIRQIKSDRPAYEQVLPLLSGIIENDYPDVIEFPEHSALGLQFQKKYPDFPTVVKLHGNTKTCLLASSSFLSSLSIRANMRAQVNRIDRAERESVKRAYMVVSPSNWLLRKLRRESWVIPKEAKVIPNPLDISSPLLTVEPNYNSEEVLIFGRIDRLKGADLLPAIFKEVWKELPFIRFVIVGQDRPKSKKQSWKEWILSKIPSEKRTYLEFSGGINHHEIKNYLGRTCQSIFLSPVENFPYSVIESMATGQCCIVASKGGAKELGHDGAEIFTVDRSPSVLASKLIYILNNKDECRRIGTAARKRVQKTLSSHQIARLMEKIYFQAILKSSEGK